MIFSPYRLIHIIIMAQRNFKCQAPGKIDSSLGVKIPGYLFATLYNS
jgi:hypothetical protein